MTIKQVRILILLLILIISLTFCTNTKREHEEILLKKGYIDMEKRLKPEIVQINKFIDGLWGLNLRNKVGTVNEKGEFCLLELEENYNIKLEVISPGFPPYLSDKYYSDNEHNMIWMLGGRGFYALDLETKETRHLVVSYFGDDGILNSFLADPEKKIFFIEVVQYNLNPTQYYILYDFIQDKIIFESPIFKGLMFRFYDHHLLYCEFIKVEGKYIRKW